MGKEATDTVIEKVNKWCEVRDSRIHGKGLFASRDIPRGKRIIQYVGELIDKEESDRRGVALMEQSKESGGPAVLIFDLNDEHDLDGNVPGNPAKYANHSCNPNAEAENIDDEIWLSAIKKIRRGKEITFDYGYDLEHFLDHPCRCGSKNCVGYIVSQDQWKKLKKILRGRKRGET